MREEKIVFACAVRNCSIYLNSVYANIFNLASLFKEYKIIFIESDSSDNTLEGLYYFQSLNSNIEIVSLGKLESQYPTRTDRIAIARNTYLDIVESKYKDYDLLCLFDADDRSSNPIEPSAILSNLNYDNWDMMCANQENKYYDLWALRHPIWMPFDLIKQLRHKPSFMSYNTANNIFSLSRQIIIPRDHSPIKVESAFGGMALVKIPSIKGARHSSRDEDGEEYCEWVPFCKSLNNGNANIYINPAFINGKGNI
jgi:hypothetical protein